MNELIQLIKANPTISMFIFTYELVAAVTSLPKPNDQDKSFYSWFYRFMYAQLPLGNHELNKLGGSGKVPQALVDAEPAASLAPENPNKGDVNK